jgi:iron complex outermembrane receptor protein
MQKIIFLLVSILSGLCLDAQSLSGNITDSVSHQPIEDAAVYFPQLKTGARADLQGHYHIDIPKGTYQVEVEMLGYATVTKTVRVDSDAHFNFMMSVAATTSKEVVITALGNATTTRRAPVPVTVVPHEMLIQQSSTNVIDAIALQPGISEISEGPGISKPVINGLGYNRVLTLFDGERQEDFQWGDEHGILIDPYAVYDAEIIRGPASLQYGANAVGGVISFKSEPMAENGTIRGSFQSEYQTNNGLIGNSVNIGGNHNGFVWDIRGSYEEAHCYSDPKDGYVWGTAYNQGNVRASIGWYRDWGYSRISVSALHRQIGVPDGERDSATGRFVFDVPLNAQYNANGQYIPGTGQIFPTRSNFLSYSVDISGYQILNHNTAWWQTSVNAGRGKIGIDIGFSESVRHEIDSGTVPEENMTVYDIPYSLKYQLEDAQTGLKLTTGINGMYEFMKNGAEPPSPYVGDFEIPDYHLFDLGAYAILQKDFKNLTLSGGVRYDFRSIVGQALYLSNYGTSSQAEVPAGTPGAYTQFPAFNEKYNGVSASIGASYQLPKDWYIKLNFAKSYRAPAINELTSNELDPANVFKQGDPNLKPEQGYEGDLGLGYHGKDVSLELDGYFNYIHDFIFPARIQSSLGGDSIEQGAPVYKYGATTAWITGVSAYFNIHPRVAKWIEIDNGFSYTYSFLPGQTDSTQHVPFTPAPRLTSEVKFKLPTGHTFLSQLYVKFGLAHYWSQSVIYSALYNELPSEAYTLYNIGIGTNFIDPKTKRVYCTLVINCTNLFNIAYVDHMSRTQYFVGYNPTAPGNPSAFGPAAGVVTQTSQGIYNMGRNVGFKLIFPFGGGVGRNRAPDAGVNLPD